jgi:hypothetical protein
LSLFYYFQCLIIKTGEQEFAKFLIKMGNGELPIEDGEDLIKIPDECISERNLVDEIFLNNQYTDEEVCILSPKNVDVKSVNEEVLKKLLPGVVNTCKTSIDSIISDDEMEHVNFPQEYLNSITPSGMPHHQLNLKVGCIVMLLRNLNSKLGLCNGKKNYKTKFRIQ